MTPHFGIDLAWGEGTSTRPAKETGLVCVDDRGTVVDAGWARGIDAVTEWLIGLAQPGDLRGIHQGSQFCPLWRQRIYFCGLG